MRAAVPLAGLAAIVWAQLAAGQVIQLPSFHSFSVDTTVVVPDAGRASIAGNRQGRGSASRMGPGLASRSIGVDRQAAGVRALATIHELHQTDAARRNSAPSVDRWAGRTAATDRAVQSLMSIERQPRVAQGGRRARDAGAGWKGSRGRGRG